MIELFKWPQIKRVKTDLAVMVMVMLLMFEYYHIIII